MAHYDACLQRLGLPYQDHYIDTHWGTTHVVAFGDQGNKPVVLWHGGHGNAMTWTAWIAALVPCYRLYAVDTIGEMGKSAPNRPDKSGPAYGQWAAETLDGLRLKRASMIGISNGG